MSADTDLGQMLWTLDTKSCTGCACICDPHTGETHFQPDLSHRATPADSATDYTDGPSSNTDTCPTTPTCNMHTPQ